MSHRVAVWSVWNQQLLQCMLGFVWCGVLDACLWMLSGLELLLMCIPRTDSLSLYLWMFLLGLSSANIEFIICIHFPFSIFHFPLPFIHLLLVYIIICLPYRTILSTTTKIFIYRTTKLITIISYLQPVIRSCQFIWCESSILILHICLLISFYICIFYIF